MYLDYILEILNVFYTIIIKISKTLTLKKNISNLNSFASVSMWLDNLNTGGNPL